MVGRVAGLTFSEGSGRSHKVRRIKFPVADESPQISKTIEVVVMQRLVSYIRLGRYAVIAPTDFHRCGRLPSEKRVFDQLEWLLVARSRAGTADRWRRRTSRNSRGRC